MARDALRLKPHMFSHRSGGVKLMLVLVAIPHHRTRSLNVNS
jgi:hypothetical protein